MYAATTPFDAASLTQLHATASINKIGRGHNGPSCIAHDVGHTKVDRKTFVTIDRIQNNATAI